MESTVFVVVTNLVCFVRQIGAKRRQMFGIFHPQRCQVVPFGVGAAVNDAGRKMLENNFGAVGSRIDQGTGGVRFEIDREELEEVVDLFGGQDSLMTPYEQSPAHRIMAWLVGRERGSVPVLTVEEAGTVQPLFVKTIVQSPAQPTSASVRVPTYQVLKLFELVMSPVLLEKFCGSPTVRPLSAIKFPA